MNIDKVSFLGRQFSFVEIIERRKELFAVGFPEIIDKLTQSPDIPGQLGLDIQVAWGGSRGRNRLRLCRDVSYDSPEQIIHRRFGKKRAFCMVILLQLLQTTLNESFVSINGTVENNTSKSFAYFI